MGGATNPPVTRPSEAAPPFQGEAGGNAVGVAEVFEFFMPLTEVVFVPGRPITQWRMAISRNPPVEGRGRNVIAFFQLVFSTQFVGGEFSHHCSALLRQRGVVVAIGPRSRKSPHWRSVDYRWPSCSQLL